MVLAEQLNSIRSIRWHKDKRTNYPNPSGPKEMYPRVNLLDAYNESVRLYRDFLLPFLREAEISLVGKKVRIIGGGVGSALDAAALMHITGAGAVEVVEVDEKDVRLAQSLQEQLAGIYEFQDAVNNVTIIPSDASGLPNTTNKINGEKRSLGLVPLSIIRNIPLGIEGNVEGIRNAENILKGMIRSTQPGGVVFATILDNPYENKDQNYLDEQRRAAVIFEKLEKEGNIGGPQFRELTINERINGGGLFGGDRGIFIAHRINQRK